MNAMHSANTMHSATPEMEAQLKEQRFVILNSRRQNINAGNSQSAAANNNNSTELENTENYVDDVIMSIYWRNGKLGAAHYNFQTSQLHILDEIVDRRPEHQILHSLFRQVQPFYVITEGHLQESFIKCLKQLVGQQDSSASSNICKLQFLPSKEYSYESCKRRIFLLNLPALPTSASIVEKNIFIRTVVNFSYNQSVHALGAVLKFVDKNWSNINMNIQGKPEYLSLNRMSLNDIVTIDDDTYRGLQIFHELSHPSNFKKGMQGSAKEGLSIYSMFNKCYSKVGMQFMKRLLQHPSRDMEKLERRYQVLEFCIKINNEEIVHNICCSLRYVKNVNVLMTRIKNLSASPFEWKSLYNLTELYTDPDLSTEATAGNSLTTENTLYNAMLICEICESALGSAALIDDLGTYDNGNLYTVALYMNRIIDFDLSKKQGKFTVKTGVDPELDQKKQVMASLHGLMSTTAKCELENLPQFIEECTMVYIPHLGYLLGVKAWSENLTMEEKQLPELKFMFQNHDYIHYKSKGCEELDVMIGDTYPEIMAHEMKIMMKLTDFILENLHTLSDIIDKCAELDCLIVMAKICSNNNYVKPTLTADKSIIINKGRHPLQEMCVNNFVPNDTYSTTDDGFMKVLTGPNSSGKSVYLKQVALIVYLAHIGSFVPAEYARIGIVSNIYTRIQSVESISQHMSAFLIDLRQMALALQETSNNSLVIIDEFGKGTSEVDGLSLLAACLNTLLYRDEFCPHTFVSTHFCTITDYLISSPWMKAQQLEYTVQDGELIFLYKIIDGRSETSFAHSVALLAGIDDSIISRAKDILKHIEHNTVPTPEKEKLCRVNKQINIMKKILQTNPTDLTPLFRE